MRILAVLFVIAVFGYSRLTRAQTFSVEPCQIRDIQADYESEGEKPVVFEGTLLAKKVSNGKYEMSMTWVKPDPSQIELGVGTFRKLNDTDAVDLRENCVFVEEKTGAKFCSLVSRYSVIQTPDVGGDGNDSFVAYYQDAKGNILGRLVKVGWYISACQPKSK